MSTIASPRDSSLRRFPSGTPNSSARPSIDTVRSSGVTSPNNTTNPTNPPPQVPAAAPSSSKRSNRAALREYYNLRAAAPKIEVPDSEVPASDVDAADFDADEYVAKVVAESSLDELLRLYTRVLSEVRALDAEKKALVYDNYSKLITATETIRKMRANMDPLNPMASTLDPAIAQIYSQASAIRQSLRDSIPALESDQGKEREAERRRQRTRRLAVDVLAAPERMRELVSEGKVAEARKLWAMPRRLLLSWQERGFGGDDVGECLAEGDGVLREAEKPASGRPSRDERPSRDGK